MVDRETVLQVREQYPWASWAIWDEDFPDGDCIESTPTKLADFVLDRTDQLTPDVVLLGLNRSDTLSTPFQNFHAATRSHYDYRLKEFIQDPRLDRLQGAYMTDLVNEVDSNEGGITVTEADADVFLDQLRTLDQTEYHIICFGSKPFQGVIDHFGIDADSHPYEIAYASTESDGHPLHFYQVWFYGAWGANQDKVEILKNQLTYLNDKID